MENNNVFSVHQMLLIFTSEQARRYVLCSDVCVTVSVGCN